MVMVIIIFLVEFIRLIAVNTHIVDNRPQSYVVWRGGTEGKDVT